MKTTVEIEDGLFVAAKKAAAGEHCPLRTLIEEGLRMRLEKPYRARRRKIKWVVAEGGVPEEVKDREAMYDSLKRGT